MITRIFYINNKYYVFCSIWKSVAFDRKLISFRVEQETDLISIHLADLHFYNRLVGFTAERDKSRHVLKNFHVPFEWSNVYLKLLTEQELQSDDLMNKFEINEGADSEDELFYGENDESEYEENEDYESEDE